jgi:hypothetical protein
MSAAALPLIFACDVLLPPLVQIRTAQVVEIAAPPAAVWRALISTAPIQPLPPWPLRLGIAYPLRSEIRGEGVGAERLGVFSTGVAHERITAWQPDQRLAFTVLDDPPMMREMSPYAHVHAPHVRGYFHTGETSFELQPLASGRTRLLETTAHELRLDPALYWLPMARMVIDQNNARVLANIRRTAEREEAAACAARNAATVARWPPLRQSRTAFGRWLDAWNRRA